MSGHKRQVLQTIKLSAHEREELLDEVRGSTAIGPYPAWRQRRAELDLPLVLLATQTREGNEACYTAIPRNLSEGGIAVLIGRFLWDQTPCSVLLPTIDDNWHRVSGQVVRCRYLRDGIHEVAVRFEQPVTLEQYIPLDEQNFTELDQQLGPDAEQAAAEDSSPSQAEVSDAPPS